MTRSNCSTRVLPAGVARVEPRGTRRASHRFIANVFHRGWNRSNDFEAMATAAEPFDATSLCTVGEEER